MQKRDGGILFSASDIVNYLECEHLTTLDLVDLETPLPRSADSDEAKLIQDKGIAHEAEFLAALKRHHEHVIDISQGHATMAQKVDATRKAMMEWSRHHFSGDAAGWPLHRLRGLFAQGPASVTLGCMELRGARHQVGPHS